MAKLALKNRELKRRKTVAKFKSKRQALLEILGSSQVSDEEKEAAAQRLAHEAAQPLRADRPAARRISQVRARPQQAARSRAAWRGAGRHQGELVRRAR
jgi:hypothetical protein